MDSTGLRKRTKGQQVPEPDAAPQAPLPSPSNPQKGYGLGRWCATICCFLMWAPACWLLVDYAYLTLSGRPWAVIRSYGSERNPAWSRARYRATEHSDNNLFNQWYYSMITDAETKATFSLGFGGFHGDGIAGGWIKAYHAPGVANTFKPEIWYPFDNMVADKTLNIKILRNVTTNDSQNPDNIFFQLDVLDENRLRYRASFPKEDSEIDITFTRVYGTFSEGDEKCHIANLPFAYGSLAEGYMVLQGHRFNFDHSARYRAYVESTWGCTFPRPGLDEDDPITYPWKWMWAMVPDVRQYALAASLEGQTAFDGSIEHFGSRSGLIRGEVGLVVANARMYDDAMGTVTGTFAFLDLPEYRISGANLTLWDHSKWQFPALLASNTGLVVGAEMTHARFMPFSDRFGEAFLPEQQNLTIISDTHEVYVRFVSQPKEFVRVPVPYKDKQGRRHVCSDFRASHSWTQIQVYRRLSAEAQALLAASADDQAAFARGQWLQEKEVLQITGEAKEYLQPCPFQSNKDGQDMCLVLLDAVTPHNAVEFAYHAPYHISPEEEAAIEAVKRVH